MPPESSVEPSIESSEKVVRKAPTVPKSEAVNFFREVTGKWPNAAQEKVIDEQVTDLAHWNAVITAWRLHGYSPVNVKGMLEWYNKGIPHYTKDKETENERVRREWLEEQERKRAARNADGK